MNGIEEYYDKLFLDALVPELRWAETHETHEPEPEDKFVVEDDPDCGIKTITLIFEHKGEKAYIRRIISAIQLRDEAIDLVKYTKDLMLREKEDFMAQNSLLVKDIMPDLEHNPSRKEKVFKDFVKKGKSIGSVRAVDSQFGSMTFGISASMVMPVRLEQMQQEANMLQNQQIDSQRRSQLGQALGGLGRGIFGGG